MNTCLFAKTERDLLSRMGIIMNDILGKLFIEKEEYKFPIVFRSDNFKDELSCLRDSYVNDLKQFYAAKCVVDGVDKFRKLCVESLSYYLRGIHSQSFNCFEKAIGELKIDNSHLLKTSIKKEDLLFRGRENSDIADYNDDQMYHIPLNCRSIVSTQRYSFPGLPCLYVGASVYTCWVEMNRPSFEKFQVAMIKPSDEACQKEVFDLSNIPQRISAIQNENWFNLDEYLLYWPLLAVCSIKVIRENAPFKPEYIFPQFLLEYILKQDCCTKIVGIKYASIKSSMICSNQLDEDWHTYVNYVFPSRSDSTEDIRCRTLNNLFSISRNRSGKELQVLTRMLEIDNAKLKINGNDDVGTVDSASAISEKSKKIFLYTRDAQKYPYSLSIFGMLEKALRMDGYEDLSEDTPTIGTLSNEEIDQMFINDKKC